MTNLEVERFFPGSRASCHRAVHTPPMTICLPIYLWLQDVRLRRYLRHHPI